MVAQYCKCNKCHCIARFKTVCFTTHKFYVIKKEKKKTTDLDPPTQSTPRPSLAKACGLWFQEHTISSSMPLKVSLPTPLPVPRQDHLSCPSLWPCQLSQPSGPSRRGSFSAHLCTSLSPCDSKGG